MWSLYVGLYLSFTVLATVLFLPKYYLIGLKKDNYKQFLYAASIGKWWGRKIFLSTKSTIEVIGEENIPKDKTLLVVSNHQSNFDIPALLGFLDIPFGFIAKKELSKIPFFSAWMKRFKCVFMDRSDARKSLAAILEAIENINNGYSQLIFPEGTRSKCATMGEFKQGSLKIATKTNTTILPITISGTYKMLEETKKVTKSHVKLTIHKPIEVSNLDEENKKNITEYVRNIISSGL